MRNRKILFFLMVYTAISLFGRDAGVIEKTYSARQIVASDGLPQMQMTTMHTDSKGFVWVGTRYTFAKWDGKELKSFNSKLKESYEYVVWFDELPNGFNLVFFRPTGNSELKFVMINGNSVKHYKLVDSVFSQIDKIFFSITSNETIQISVHKNNQLFVFEYNINNNKLVYKKRIVNVGVVLNANKGNLFFSTKTAFDTSHIFLYNYKKNNLTSLNVHVQDSFSSLKNKKSLKKYIKTYLNFEKNEVWFYYSNKNKLFFLKQKIPFRIEGKKIYDKNIDGILYLDKNVTYLYNYNELYKLINLPISYCVHKDFNNNYLIGTDIGLYNFYKFGISELKLKLNSEYDNIWSMTRDKKGAFYFSSFTNGIFKSDKSDNFTRVKLSNVDHIGGFGSITNAFNDVLLPLSMKGKVYFVINNKIQEFDCDKGSEIYASTIDPKTQDIYFSDLKSIYKFDAISKKLQKLKTALDTLNLKNIISLSFTKDRKLIVKTSNESYLVKLDGSYNFLTKYNILGYSIFCDNRNGIWESYSTSLYYLYGNKCKKLQNLSISTSILSLSQYKKWLLIGTSREIIFMDLEQWYKTGEEKYIVYSIENEINILEGGQNNIFVDEQEDMIYWPCLDKVLKLNPNLLTNIDTVPPKVSIDEYILYNEGQKKATIDTIGQKEYKLGSNIRNIDVIISNPQYLKNSFLKYRYRLNSDDIWKMNQSSQIIRLINLASGVYNLEIQTSFDGIHWSDSVKSLPIVIQSKYYETAFFWFFFLVIVFAIGSMIVIYFLEKQKIKYQIEVRKQVEKNNLQLQVIKSKYIPHFTFNAITSINYLLRKKEIRKASSYLVKMTDLQRIALTNFEKPEIPLETELKFLDSYLSLESLRFEEKLQYHINLSSNIDKNILVPNLCIHTMVENAIKHGLNNKLEGIWKLDVYIIKRFNKLILSVEDNGIGVQNTNGFNENSMGTGLIMLEKQLQILNSDFVKYSFKLETKYTVDQKVKGARSSIIIEYKLPSMNA